MPIFKAQLRIPTEMYAYIEVSVEDTAENIFMLYKELTAMSKPQEGLLPKEFNAALDQYLTDGTGVTETYLKMSPAQKAVFQEVKKAFKRLHAKEIKNNNGHDNG